MAIIQQGTADRSVIGNPSAGDFYIFNDSNNGDAYTRRDSSGTDIILGGSPATPLVYYSQKATNTNGGTVNAAFGSPLECIPSSGTLEITVAETGSYIIFGMVNIGIDLNKDSGAIELMYGIDTGGGAVIGPVPYSQNGQHKKNKANGIQGAWGNISLTAGDVVHLFLSTLGDSTTWTAGEIFIQTWK